MSIVNAKCIVYYFTFYVVALALCVLASRNRQYVRYFDRLVGPPPPCFELSNRQNTVTKGYTATPHVEFVLAS